MELSDLPDGKEIEEHLTFCSCITKLCSGIYRFFKRSLPVHVKRLVYLMMRWWMCRMTSTMFPWCTEYEMEDLPDWEEIKGHLAFAGDLARAYDIRMTFHPSHFIKLAADNEDLLAKSLKEMEVHSKVGC